MEVANKQRVSIRSQQTAESSFECDALAMDALLEWNRNGQTNLRLDQAQEVPCPKTEFWSQVHDQQNDFSVDASASNVKQVNAVDVYAPIEIVPSAKLRFDESLKANNAHCDLERQGERLMRLLDQQQSWYDAQRQAALAAEQFLALCEQHQQQWLHPTQQNSQASPATKQ